jgi:hypothetical protein
VRSGRKPRVDDLALAGLAARIAALDAAVGFPSGLLTRTPRGLFWAMATRYGHEGAGAFDVFFPHGGRRIRKAEWLAVIGTVPISLDEKVSAAESLSPKSPGGCTSTNVWLGARPILPESVREACFPA